MRLWAGYDILMVHRTNLKTDFTTIDTISYANRTMLSKCIRDYTYTFNNSLVVEWKIVKMTELRGDGPRNCVLLLKLKLNINVFQEQNCLLNTYFDFISQRILANQ